MRAEFNQLTKIILDSLKRSGLEPKFRERQAVDKWGEVVGARIARVTTAETIRDGILYVSCKNGTWANELTFLREDIVRKLNAKIGGPFVKDIRFSTRSQKAKVEEAPAEEPRRISEKELEDVRLSEEDEQKIEAAAQASGNEDLAARIRRVVTNGRKVDEWKKAHGWKNCSSCGLLFEGDKCPACRK